MRAPLADEREEKAHAGSCGHDDGVSAVPALTAALLTWSPRWRAWILRTRSPSSSISSSPWDFPGVAGVTLVIGVMYVAVNAVVDILQAVADPRIRR